MERRPNYISITSLETKYCMSCCECFPAQRVSEWASECFPAVLSGFRFNKRIRRLPVRFIVHSVSTRKLGSKRCVQWSLLEELSCSTSIAFFFFFLPTLRLVFSHHSFTRIDPFKIDFLRSNQEVVFVKNVIWGRADTEICRHRQSQLHNLIRSRGWTYWMSQQTSLDTVTCRGKKISSLIWSFSSTPLWRRCSTITSLAVSISFLGGIL